MKHKNLEILKQNNFNVPKFTTVKSPEDYTPVDSFLLSNEIKYAVRSSCDIEDGDKESCAGKFETILNLEKKDIPNAIKTVFDSMKQDNNNNGCVIVQEMVEADFSGVVFTANPVDGILNETVVVVGNGLGNKVVDDETDTTTYFHNQDDGIYYYEQSGDSPLLAEDVLTEILQNAEKIQNLFRKYMDIEFAIKDNIVYILQARPITTFSGKKPIILDNSNIVESYPETSLPLTQSFVKEIYHDIFYKCVERITKTDKTAKEMDYILQDMIQSANWRIYYQIDNWYSFLRLMPFSNKIISIWQDMLGVDNRFVSDNMKHISFKTKCTVFFSFLHYLRKTPQYMEELNKSFNEKYKEYKKLVSETNDISLLLNIYKTIKTEILSEWDITLVNDMYTFVYTALAGKKNKEFISDIKNLESMKPIFAINELVVIAKEYGYESDLYQRSFKKYIEDYGDRCLGELKLETKTYRTHPELLTEYVERKISQKDMDFGEKPSYAEKNNLFVKRAKLGIENREISRLNRSRIFGITREIFRKIGEILKSENKIENVDDVFYLYINELENTSDDFKKLIGERKNTEKMIKSIPHYSRLVFDEKVSDKVWHFGSVESLNSSNELCGTPTSAGIVEGEVLVVDVPNETIDTTNKILVAKSTDPGWVFLIKNAKGIIAEKGSLLSHTAIISRELKKPAIVNVKDCTRILHSGDKVLLDASTGKITIIEKI